MNNAKYVLKDTDGFLYTEYSEFEKVHFGRCKNTLFDVVLFESVESAKIKLEKLEEFYKGKSGFKIVNFNYKSV